jgi:myosin heavy subunit
MKDTKSLLLVLLSVGLVGTWIYHLYDKALYSQQKSILQAADSTAVANTVKDSLSKVYNSSINEMDARLLLTKVNADSLQGQLELKLNEIYQLKAEISSILNNKTSSREEVTLARQKMVELQQKVEALSQQNLSMEEEKTQLNQVLTRLTDNMDSLQRNIRKLSTENEVLTEKINQAAVFMASDVRLIPTNIRLAKEQETNQLKKTDKFVVSFAVQNNLDQDNAEIVIVIIQPDKQVLQNSSWDSGLFDTKSEGKKKFTRIIKFDYSKGEKRDLNFTLDAAPFQKGNYTLQLWHKGVLIGKSIAGLQ